jgi:CheY-like chemotaxis protein
MMRTVKKVVIVDDDPVVLRVAAKLLRDAGYEVATYGGATERLSFIFSQEPDLVLIDVNMPFLTGNRLVDLMKQDDRLRRIPVVFFSSNPEEQLRELVTTTGAQGFIHKSEINAELPAKIASFIDEAAGGARSAPAPPRERS